MTINGKWAVALLVVLVLSVCLNVFVAGLAFGRFAGGWPGPGPGPGPRPEAMVERGIDRFVSGLPHDARHQVRERLAAQRPEIAARFRAMRQARMEVAELLRADPVDRAAIEQALVEVRERTMQAQTLIQNTVLEAILELPADVRAAWEPRWLGGPPKRRRRE